MAYIINTDNRQLIDAGENQLSFIERPNIIYGDGGVLSFDLLSGRMPLECSTSDTWELYADTDYIHTTGAGLLANGYSGAVTSIEVTDLTNTPELTGFLLLQNSAGERDRIPYSEYNAGTGIFTVDDTLENIYLAGDSVLIEDQLVLYSGNANFNNSADREDVNVLTGKICVRYDALTRGFLNKITAPNTRVHIEIWRYIPGQLRPQKVLQDDIYCSPTVGTLEGAPSTNDPVYYTAAQTLALLNAGYEIELSDDGITWYELTFDELEQPIMPLTARWWHYRNALTNGNWSATVPLLVGPKGDKGDGLKIDAIGLLSGLSAYDDEPTGFTYLASDTGNVYFKLSATTADWSNPVPFKGEKGDDGASSYTYIAYASDDEGTDFNLTPSAALPYRAEIVSATPLTPPTSTDFASAVWVKYIGEDGASTANAVSVVSSGFTGNLSTDIETVQDALDEIDALELGSGSYNDLLNKPLDRETVPMSITGYAVEGYPVARMDDVYDSIEIYKNAVGLAVVEMTVRSADDTITGNIVIVPVINGVDGDPVTIAVTASWAKVSFALEIPAGTLAFRRDHASASDTLKDGASVITAQVIEITYRSSVL